MKNVRLNALNMDVSVANNVFYFDEGYVQDLKPKLDFLKWKHGIGEYPVPNNAFGHMVCADSGQGSFFYVFYLKSQDGWTDIRVRAHEETHALDKMAGLQQLNGRIRASGFNVNLPDYDYETRACIGGGILLLYGDRI